MAIVHFAIKQKNFRVQKPITECREQTEQIGATMKRIRICVLSLILAFVSLFAIGCDNSPTNNDKVAYLGESVAFSNGIEFSVERHIYKSEIKVGYTNYVTNDIFLCIEIKVKNNSDSVYSVSGTDIWLLYGKTKIGQVDIVKRWEDGYYNISQPATTTKTYVSCFELSADIPFEDLTLVFDNGKWLNNEQAKILLKNRLSD